SLCGELRIQHIATGCAAPTLPPSAHYGSDGSCFIPPRDPSLTSKSIQPIKLGEDLAGKPHNEQQSCAGTMCSGPVVQTEYAQSQTPSLLG
ncbi:hypothetical protein KUCAC02_032431, partial [Chaenocephalus aceratus]